jgi:hypothetical protein
MMEGKAVIARQVEPELQMGPLWHMVKEWRDGVIWEDVTVCGNRSLSGRTTGVYDWLKDALPKMAYDLEAMREYPGEDGFESVGQLVGHYAGRVMGDDARALSEEDAARWERLLASESVDGQWALAEGMELLTGRRHQWAVIRGTCQSDWQNVLYPTDTYNQSDIRILEAEYFNTGREWELFFVDANRPTPAPEDLDSEWSLTTYTYDLGSMSLREELAECHGAEPYAVTTVYEFDRYERHPKYRLSEG